MVLASALASCSSDTPAPGGAAGSTPSGAGSVGAAGSAGNPAGGGAPGAAGNVGSAGSAGLVSPTAGAGGSPSAGGAPSTGGSNPGGGTTGNAGAGGAPPSTGVTVKLDGVHQTIQGFGLNDALLSSTWSTQVLDNLFTTTGADGIGLQVLRIGMNTTGGLNGTTQSNLAGAKSRGAKIIGSCWSPPANCKSNNSTQDGGHTLASCYDSWSTTIASFAKTNGLYAMSIGNEPDFASCGNSEPCNGNYDTTLYTAKEMVAFIKVAGPKLQANNVKVIAPEASEWIHQWSNESGTGSDPGNKNSSDPLKCGFPASNAACTTGDGYDYGHWLAKDADAWKALDIIGVHEYDTQHAEPWPSDVTVARKEVWQTEMSGVKWWKEQGPSATIQNGVAVAGWIHSALVVGEASAWLWWWYSAYNTDDNEGLLLKGTTAYTKRYYTLGNYSKFVRPGYVMVDVTGNTNTDVLLSAFKGTDGTVVVVAINKGAAAATIPITISGGTAPTMMTPNVTSATDNLKAGTAVAVTGGVLMAALPSQTVTTFVGK
ncbi:MAG: glycoside hydrolase family 30 beta sandwich domain-containing protein [Pseudomonadota bacterium]